MSDSVMKARVELLLGELKLPTIRQMHEKIAKEVATSGGDFGAYLHSLLEEEVSERRSRRVQRRLKEARFRQIKTLEELEAGEWAGGPTRPLSGAMLMWSSLEGVAIHLEIFDKRFGPMGEGREAVIETMATILQSTLTSPR